MIRLLLSLFIITSCQSNPTDHLTVRQFDSENSKEIDSLCNSLLMNIGRNKDYLMYLKTVDPLKRFRVMERDSLSGKSKVGDYFQVDFQPSQSQVDFLTRAGANELFFSSTKEIFFTTLRNYTSNGRAIQLYVYVGSKDISQIKKSFFKAGNHVYLLEKQ